MKSRTLALGSILLALLAAPALSAPFNDPTTFYPFDGNTLDKSGNHLDGVGTGTAFLAGHLYGYPGCSGPGQAIHFNGGSSNVTVPDNSLLGITQAISIVMYARFGRCGPAEVLLAKRVNDGNMNYVVEWGSGAGGCWIEFLYGYYPYAGYARYPVYLAQAPVLNDGNWHCLAFSLVFGQPASAMWAVDGTLLPGAWRYGDGTTDVACGTEIPTVNSSPLTIGYQLSSSPSYWLGDMDNLFMYHYALSASDLQAVCQWSTTPIDCPVAQEQQTWGSVKALYQ